MSAAPTMADKNLVATLRELLDRLAGSRKLSNDEQEEIHDAVIAEAKLLSGDGFLALKISAQIHLIGSLRRGGSRNSVKKSPPLSGRNVV